ncbi:hypothetical protein BEN74_03945 [Acinetobacter sp. WCHAc010034]|nr:hypothetical protein BEN74_03945 [Acinetobacter sp. WCHAc010034]
MNEGRKHLSQEVVIELEKLIADLLKVSPKDKPSAYNSIGIIYSYLNDFINAKEFYYQSYLLEHDEMVFANYLIMLQRLNEIVFAFEEVSSFLDNNPNNKVIFNSLIQMTCKYPSQERLEKLLEYRNYQTESREFEIDLNNKISDIKSDIKIFNKYEIDLRFYEYYMTSALTTVNLLVKNNIEIESTDNIEIDQFIINIAIKNLEYIDIINLNQKFDSRIQELVNSGLIDKSLYFDHLNKLSLYFSIIISNEVAA